MSERAIYNPAPIQTEVHLCQANEILMGGAAGGTKSMTLLMDFVQTQLRFEHDRWMKTGRRSIGWAIHFRRTFKMLEQTIERSHRLFRAIDPKATYDTQRFTWTFSCGYRFQFGHVQTDEDRFNYLSNEYTHITWDELGEMSQEVYQFINTRLRTSDPELQKRLRIVSASNPTGNWVRDYFVKPHPQGRKLLTKVIRLGDGTEVKRTRIFIPATLKDNPDPLFRASYEAELRDKPRHIMKAYLEGDWWVVAGAFFADAWIKEIHEVDRFKIPSGWKKFRSMDWGVKQPGTVGWYAVDTDENLVKYRELTFQGKDALQVAREIKAIEKEAGEWDETRDCSRLSGPADTQIWSVTGTVGPTIAETMMEEGVYWEKCTKNKPAAVMQLLLRLNDHGTKDSPPGIRFMRHCVNTIRTVPAIGTSKNNPELPDDSAGVEDHWLDETLYACMHRLVAAKADDDPHSQSYYDELGEARRKKAKNFRKNSRWNLGYG